MLFQCCSRSISDALPVLQQVNLRCSSSAAAGQSPAWCSNMCASDKREHWPHQSAGCRGCRSRGADLTSHGEAEMGKDHLRLQRAGSPAQEVGRRKQSEEDRVESEEGGTHIPGCRVRRETHVPGWRARRGDTSQGAE
ncbi:hypothetical protein FKM82_004372 [Ascaphus truei]